MLPPSLVYPYPQEVERYSARGEEEERRVGTEHLQETARRDALHPAINEKEEDGGEKLHLLMLDDAIPAGYELC